jgi:hypothetical protein
MVGFSMQAKICLTIPVGTHMPRPGRFRAQRDSSGRREAPTEGMDVWAQRSQFLQHVAHLRHVLLRSCGWRNILRQALVRYP